MNKNLVFCLLFLLIPCAYAIDGAVDCTVSTDCILGEYVYNDNYSIITTQICNLTTYYPNGTISLNNTAMTANTDGWHNYTLNYATTGLYKAYMICNGTYFEKSFYVDTSSDETEGLKECYLNTDCILGEYVYNNTYHARTTQICNLTTYYPNGTISLNNTVMTANADGWHNYTVNYDVTGLYKAFMLCDDAGDNAYLEKSFYIINEATVTVTGSSGNSRTFNQGTGEMLDLVKEQFKIETKEDIKKNFGNVIFIIIIIIALAMVYKLANNKKKKEMKKDKNKDLLEISKW